MATKKTTTPAVDAAAGKRLRDFLLRKLAAA